MKAVDFWKNIQDRNPSFLENMKEELVIPLREHNRPNNISVSMPLWIACYLSDPQIKPTGMIPYANYQVAYLETQTDQVWYGMKNLGVSAAAILRNAKNLTSARPPQPYRAVSSIKEAAFFSLLQMEEYWRGDTFTPPYDFLVAQIVDALREQPLIIRGELKRIVSSDSRSIMFGDFS